MPSAYGTDGSQISVPNFYCAYISHVLCNNDAVAEQDIVYRCGFSMVLIINQYRVYANQNGTMPDQPICGLCRHVR